MSQALSKPAPSRGNKARVPSPQAQKHPPRPTTTRRQEIGFERREKTRRKLLEGAARTIAECGEHKATIDDFIQAAGVARGTFYNYYQTRDQILGDLWSLLGRNPFLRIELAAARIKDPAERLVAKARLVMDTAARDATWGWVVFTLSADAATVNDELLRFPRPDLEEGRRSGRMDFEDVSAANDMVVGTIRNAMHAVLSEGRSPGYAAEVCILLLKAMGLRDDEARAVATRPLPLLD